MAKTSHVVTTWAGDHQFVAGRPGGPSIRMDGKARTGPSMVDTMICALAGCTGYDIEDILAKRRTPLEAMSIDAVAERADGIPARVVKVHLTYTIRGQGIDRENAERAIELAVTKYCSVKNSLNPDIPVEWTLVLEG
jgi:putative redox protein